MLKPFFRKMSKWYLSCRLKRFYQLVDAIKDWRTKNPKFEFDKKIMQKRRLRSHLHKIIFFCNSEFRIFNFY